VPERCSFTVERRFNPEEDFATEKARLLDLLDRMRQRGIRIEVETLQEIQSSGVDEADPAARALADTVESVVGKRPAFELCPGSLEIRWYAAKGIPAFAYGPGLLEISHGPNEHVKIERIYEDTLIYALYALRMLGPEGR